MYQDITKYLDKVSLKKQPIETIKRGGCGCKTIVQHKKHTRNNYDHDNDPTPTY